MHAVVLLLVIAWCAAAAPAQGVQALYAAPVDPYTRGEPAALERAGYVSLGPVPFLGNLSTQGVEQLFGDEPLVWIETAHCVIGSSLPALALRGGEEWSTDWIAGVRAELKRLAQRLPRVDVGTRELDPWLRAHLLAQRAEDTWNEVSAFLGAADHCFPPAPGDDPSDAERYRGRGPYLGMAGKFRILLVRRGASLGRLTRACMGREVVEPIRHQDPLLGCLYWGASEESANGVFRHDLALHVNLVFNLANNLYTGYRGYAHELPAWLPTGLAHWHSRRVSPRFPVYDRRGDHDQQRRSAFWEWEKRIVGLTKNNAFEPLATFLDRDQAGEFSIEQHIEAWALVDYLMQQRPNDLRAFVHAMKAPFHANVRAPTPLEQRVRQIDALRAAFDTDAAGLEAAWRAHVQKRGRRSSG